MKRSCAARTAAGGLAVVATVAGCGAAQSSATATGSAVGRPSAAGASSGRPAHFGPSPKRSAGRRWLPVLTARKVAADHLLSQKWKLLRVAQGGTAVEISYFFGPCLAPPKGVLIVESGSTVTLSLEAPNPRLAADCAPVVSTQAAWVRIPVLHGRTVHRTIRSGA
jgi:hypothetical protein